MVYCLIPSLYTQQGRIEKNFRGDDGLRMAGVSQTAGILPDRRCPSVTRLTKKVPTNGDNSWFRDQVSSYAFTLLLMNCSFTYPRNHCVKEPITQLAVAEDVKIVQRNACKIELYEIVQV